MLIDLAKRRYLEWRDRRAAARSRRHRISKARGILAISERIYYHTRQEGLEISSAEWAGRIFRARENLSELGDETWRTSDN
jgi:hypothetical protein